MVEAHRRDKKLCWGAVDEDREARVLDAVQDPMDLPLIEVELLKCLSEKSPTHSIIRLLHVQLDGNETTTTWSSLEVVHELLG